MKNNNTTTTTRTSTPSLILLFGLYTVPLLLVTLHIVPFAWRFHLLVLLTIGMAGYAYLRHFTWAELGFRTDNLYPSLQLNGIFSALIILFAILYHQFGMATYPLLTNPYFYLFYVFISSPFQEFLYRSLVFAELTRAQYTPPLQIILSAINFALLHSIYNDPTTLLLTGILGLILGYIYAKQPNIYTITFSHILVGITTIYLGIV
jgi:membrane protease YdiL (CAAX protease family)